MAQSISKIIIIIKKNLFFYFYKCYKLNLFHFYFIQNIMLHLIDEILIDSLIFKCIFYY